VSPRARVKRWLYGQCPGFAGRFSYFGTRVFFPKNSMIFLKACEEGIFEKEIVRLLTSLFDPAGYYFDVGANIGLMSIPIVTQFEQSRVVSFEPSPQTYPYLARTVANSRFKDKWRCVPNALGETVGEADFIVSSPALGAFDGMADTKRAGTTTRVKVPITTLDTEWDLLGKPEVSLIKIDVEGAELHVLRGAQRCLSAMRPFVVLEWNKTNIAPYGYDPMLLLQFAAAINYRLFSLPHMVPLMDDISLRMQMLRTENFLLAPSGTHKDSRLEKSKD
jgi:FkbM family methyltransferase